MTTIDRIIAKARKITGSDKTRRHLESLIEQAYEAGRQAAIKDITITLEDDMINDDHSKALEILSANF